MTDTLAAARNADCDWDAFAAADYHAHNYGSLRPDDARILGIVRDWFSETVPAGARLHGIDVGTGSNLGPAFALLPHCGDVTLFEYGAENMAWLERQLVDVDESWAPFALQASGLEWRRARYGLGRVARVRQGSVFDLPKRQWEIGTSFFTAESMTGDVDEFERALGCFLQALKPGVSFAIALMEGSHGYKVAGQAFPAVAVNGPEVLHILDRLGAEDLTVHRVDINPRPLRAGYSGYLVATGRA